jgi:hypothetical protein
VDEYTNMNPHDVLSLLEVEGKFVEKEEHEY